MSVSPNPPTSEVGSFNDRKKPYYGHLEKSNRLNSDFRCGIMSRREVSDEDYSPIKGDYLVAITSLTQARTINLPSASSVEKGQGFIIKDESGSSGSHHVTIVAPIPETINGHVSKVMNQDYQHLHVYSNGANWYSFEHVV